MMHVVPISRHLDNLLPSLYSIVIIIMTHFSSSPTFPEYSSPLFFAIQSKIGDQSDIHPSFLHQVVCGQNCTFVIQPNGTVLACGEGSYGRLGQGNSDDLHVLTVISALQGDTEASTDPLGKSTCRFLNTFVCL